jgi:hypothetical protein
MMARRTRGDRDGEGYRIAGGRGEGMAARRGGGRTTRVLVALWLRLRVLKGKIQLPTHDHEQREKNRARHTSQLSTTSLTNTLTNPGTSRSTCLIAARKRRIEARAAGLVMRSWICG